MVHLLLPAVALCTEGLKDAPLIVVADESACLPVSADLTRVVVEKVRLASEVLPVMSVLALGLVVVLVLEWTPFGLEVKHIELGVALVHVD